MTKEKLSRILVPVLSAVITLGFLAQFAYMLPYLGTTVGTASGEAQRERSALEFSDAYQRRVNNLSASAMEGIIPIEIVPVETVPIQETYILPENTVIAPVPDPAKFGESANPADTAAILEQASELLAGQETIWTPDTEIRQDSVVRWYLDDTIFSITWKQCIDWAIYTFTEVKVAHPSQFRRFFADNTFASPVQYLPTELAQTVNAVSAMSADFYKFRQEGIVVYQRKLCRSAGGYLDTCFVDGNGDLNFVRGGEFTDEADIQRYLEENDILFSLSFGPIMIEDGENVVPANYPVGEINDYYARAAIGQLGACHYLLVTVNHEKQYGPNAATTRMVAETLHRMGVPKAYTLDGGQTASMIVNGELINSVEFGYQRAVSDIIYFATAIPEKQEWEAEYG